MTAAAAAPAEWLAMVLASWTPRSAAAQDFRNGASQNKEARLPPADPSAALDNVRPHNVG